MTTENETKHTPGPWKTAVKQIGLGHACNGAISIIADNEIQQEICHGRFMTEANARLIIVAPNLLKALKRAVAHADPNNDPDWGCKEEAMKIIARAEGDQS